METLKKGILNKLYLVVVLMLVFLVGIVFKIVRLQYVYGEEYRELAEKTTVKNVKIPANRGNVYASDGNLLATSMSRFDIRMDVMSVKNKVFEKNISGLATELSNLLGKSKSHYQNKIRQARKHHNRYLLIARDVGYNDYVKMREFPIFNLGVYRGGFIAEQDTVRVHPIGKIAERTIGYDDHRGGAGIEGAFSNYLLGQDGSRLKQKIAKNQWKPINDVNEVEPVDGRDVITTIDVNIQDVTHHALLKSLEEFDADHGCAVVMEVNSGEIKAISNLGKTKKGKYYEKRNYAVWESHEPGSTFKLASLMVGLEDRVIDTSTVVDCGTGRYYVSGKKVEDSEYGGHGRISLARVFEVSSNVGVVKAIQKHYDARPKRFTDKLEFFGLGNKTGVKIKGEGKPYLPLPSDKKRWNSISLEWMSWGYGVSLTPLQTLMFYNAVANNGELVKPRFVKELRSGDKLEESFGKVVINKRIASQVTIDKMTKVMENVVKKGTAKNIYSPNFSMAGKTGTAKKWIPRHKNADGKVVAGHYSSKHYVASFAGFFPVENPKYSCIVVVHDPDKDKGYYGAKVAAPVFKEIAHKIYTSTPASVEAVYDSVSDKKIDKNYQRYYVNLQKYKTVMPNVVGMSGMDAISLLENMGLNVGFSGVGKVVKQSVERGLKVKKGTKIYLKLS